MGTNLSQIHWLTTAIYNKIVTVEEKLNVNLIMMKFRKIVIDGNL